MSETIKRELANKMRGGSNFYLRRSITGSMNHEREGRRVHQIRRKRNGEIRVLCVDWEAVGGCLRWQVLQSGDLISSDRQTWTV
jgi:hypothetical protein